jgi:formate/nitrite transporter
VGTTGLALLVYLSGHTHGNGGAIGATVLKIALSKQNLVWHEAFFRGVLCNVLVCMAVWMAMAGRSVMDKVIAIVFPITAFVAAGFEHSIANMYFMQLALIIQYVEPATAANTLGSASHALSIAGMFGNLIPVILGNLVGGSVFVGLVYHLIYRVAATPQPATTALIEKN